MILKAFALLFNMYAYISCSYTTYEILLPHYDVSNTVHRSQHTLYLYTLRVWSEPNCHTTSVRKHYPVRSFVLALAYMHHIYTRRVSWVATIFRTTVFRLVHAHTLMHFCFLQHVSKFSIPLRLVYAYIQRGSGGVIVGCKQYTFSVKHCQSLVRRKPHIRIT